MSFRTVRRSFAETGAVIDGFSLEIAPGEFVALLGPSGCGKSTLLRLAAGLDQPDQGAILVDDSHASFSTSSRGFVFQDAHLLPWRTVLENVALPLELKGHPADEARSQAIEAIKNVGLSESIQKTPAQLSGGMRMRVSVARALVTRPSLLLLDEPFAALDENTRFRLQEELRSLWEREGFTVLFVTHSISEAAYLAGRAIVLSPRPARMLKDHPVDLPVSREAAIRTEPAFNAEVRALRAAYVDSPEVR